MNLLSILLVAGAVLGADDKAGKPVPVAATAAIDVSGKMVNLVVARPVDRVDPVRETIIDAEVFGTGRTRGKVLVDLVPSEQYGLFELVFQGQSASQTIGIQEPLKIYSETLMNFEVRKTIGLDSRGMHGYPSRPVAKACTRLVGMTNFDDDKYVTAVDLGKCIHRAQKPQIEWESARKAECRLAAQFDEDTQASIAQANQALTEAKKHLRRVGVPLRPLRWVTTADHLSVLLTLENSAPATPPPAVDAKADLSVRVHQNGFNEAARANLAGRTMNMVELAGLLESILGPVLGAKKAGENTAKLTELLKALGVQPPVITFAKQQPATVQFVDKGFTVTLHASGFKSADKAYPARDVRAVYKIEQGPRGIVGVRVGMPQVVSPDGKKDDADDDVVAKTLLESTFGLLFLDTLNLTELTLTLPENQSVVLTPIRADAAQGWLHLAWARKSATK